MQNLIFSLNAAMPIFLMMMLGLLLRQLGWIDSDLASRLNRLVFRLFLPLLLFQNLASVDIRSSWDTGYVLYCFAVTLLSIGIASLLSFCFLRKKDSTSRALRGEFIQASYRSSAALLGMAFIENSYHNGSIAPLMIIGAVPLYNVAAVIILSLTAPQAEEESTSLLPSPSLLLKKILSNPILIGIFAGLIFSLLRFPMTGILQTSVNYLSRTATPLGLIAMGAGIELRQMKHSLRLSLIPVFLKLVGLAAIGLPLAVALGLRRVELMAVLVMLASPTTVSSYVMAKTMGHESSLTANAVLLTTLLSSLSLTLWIFFLRSLGLL